MPSARKHPRTRKVFLEANGSGPWPCSFCGELVHQLGRRRREGNIHHLDEDMTNDSPENLAIGHHACHARHHAMRRDMSSLVKQQWIDGKHVFIPQSAEVRHRQAQSLTGRTVPTEVRKKISATLKGRSLSEPHRASIREAWARRKQPQGDMT